MIQDFERATGTLLRLVGVVSATAYIVGFVVETMYLGIQGFFVLDLIKAQYVFSGFVLVCFLGVSITVAVRWSVPQMRRASNLMKNQAFWSAVRPLHAAAAYCVLAGYSAACLLVALQTVAGRGSLIARAADVMEFAPQAWAITIGYFMILGPGALLSYALRLVEKWTTKRPQPRDTNGRPTRSRTAWWTRSDGVLLPVLVVCEAVLAAGGLHLLDSLLPGVHRVVLFLPAYGLGTVVALLGGGAYIAVTDAISRDKASAEVLGRSAMSTTRDLSTTWITVSPLLIVGLVMGMWLYSGVVFPSLTRSVGGGAPERIFLSTKNTELKALLDGPAKQIYVVHQSDRYVLLQVRQGDEITDRLYVPASSVDFFQLSLK